MPETAVATATTRISNSDKTTGLEYLKRIRQPRIKQ